MNDPLMFSVISKFPQFQRLCSAAEGRKRSSIAASVDGETHKGKHGALHPIHSAYLSFRHLLLSFVRAVHPGGDRTSPLLLLPSSLRDTHRSGRIKSSMIVFGPLLANARSRVLRLCYSGYAECSGWWPPPEYRISFATSTEQRSVARACTINRYFITLSCTCTEIALLRVILKIYAPEQRHIARRPRVVIALFNCAALHVPPPQASYQIRPPAQHPASTPSLHSPTCVTSTRASSNHCPHLPPAIAAPHLH